MRSHIEGGDIGGGGEEVVIILASRGYGRARDKL